MQGLCALEPPPLALFDRARIDVERLRHLLWNGDHDKACVVLGRVRSWAKDAIVLAEPGLDEKVRRLAARCTELHSYVENSEGTVNQLVNARMNKRRQMRWSPQGAHRVLQVRAALLDGRLGHQAIQLAA